MVYHRGDLFEPKDYKSLSWSLPIDYRVPNQPICEIANTSKETPTEEDLNFQASVNATDNGVTSRTLAGNGPDTAALSKSS